MVGLLYHQFNAEGLGQRGIADLIEEKVKHSYQELVFNTPLQWHDAPTVRSVEDFSITEAVSKTKIYYDVKTTDLDREFSMPNLISAKRLHRLYQNPSNQIVYILVAYKGKGSEKTITSIEERPIETIPWEHIGIQNLGEGQLQLIGKGPFPYYEGSRADWMADLKKHMVEYLDRTMIKMEKRKQFWNT